MKKLVSGMILYHGSYCVVDKPDLSKCAKYKDFGQGFYLTSSKRQAKNFSKISVSKAKNDGMIPENSDCGYISCFRVNGISELSCYYYDTADIHWLHCIVAHRRKRAFVDVRKEMYNYDVIAGKIANDDTNTTINAYMSHVFGKMGSPAADNMCIGLLIPERLQDQFCFRSEKSISKLSFLHSECISLRQAMLKDKTIFAMDLTILMAVEDLASETGLTTEEVLLSLMASDTGRRVYDDSQKLWWDGPEAVIERYKRECADAANTTA